MDRRVRSFFPKLILNTITADSNLFTFDLSSEFQIFKLGLLTTQHDPFINLYHAPPVPSFGKYWFFLHVGEIYSWEINKLKNKNKKLHSTFWAVCNFFFFFNQHINESLEKISKGRFFFSIVLERKIFADNEQAKWQSISALVLSTSNTESMTAIRLPKNNFSLTVLSLEIWKKETFQIY